MSKIQKALDALRNSPDVKQDEAGRSFAPQAKRRVHRGDAVSQDANRTGGATIDLTPVGKVSIDLERLMSLRMLPAPSDEDAIAQQFRRIKRPILQVAFDDDLPSEDYANVIMMASALPGAGKSFCTLNLARSISMERDFGAVVVDADVLKPGVSRAVGLEDEVGLIDYLVDPDMDISQIMYASDLNDIIIIPAGRRHPEATELLASRRMRDFVRTISEHYMSHAIVFDTPPMLLTSEAQVLAERVGQIVLVIESRKSSQDSVMRALGMLDRDKPINAILNKSRSANGGGYSSDDYGYYSSSLRQAGRSTGNETDN